MSESKYREVLAALSERIDSGFYFQDGRDGRMETVEEMQVLFGVGRTTMRFALAILEDRGVIRPHQGARWLVVARTAQRGTGRGSHSVSAESDQANGSTGT
jgi:DNA-binding GntR family transcriptional regulator